MGRPVNPLSLPADTGMKTPDRSLTKWISITGRLTQMYLNRHFEPYGLNASQHMFVLNICRFPGMTQDRLPELVHINKSNVTRALSQLEQSGFIVRRTNRRDRRTTRIYPTDKARAVYPALVEITETWNSILVGKLSLEEKSLLYELITRVASTALGFIASDEEPR